MYCSSCGVAIAPGLSYCNYCGAKLNRAEEPPREVAPGLLVSAMAVLFIFGLIAITMLLGAMTNAMGIPVDRALIIAAIPFLLLLLLEGAFLTLLLRQRRPKSQADIREFKGQATKELESRQPLPLPEHRTVSVTEHTTRAFDPSYTKRK